MNILLTGSTGFLGQALAKKICESKRFNLAVSLRKPRVVSGAIAHEVGDLGADNDWSSALRGQQVVIHAAARAHILREETLDPLTEYRRVNVLGTLNLARQAASAGVKRFIFISSIGVNGNTNECPFTADDQPNPVEPYAHSKWEAEQGLWEVCKRTGMDLVILRPPLVYGPGAPGNFGSLVRWIQRGVPMPLGAIHNRRSLVGLDNLVDLVIRCVEHPAAANQVFLAADGQDLSTTELLRGVAKAMDKPARLIPVPAGVLQFVANLLGKRATAQRLLGSLQVDIGKTCDLLDWRPPYSVEEGLRRCFENTRIDP